MKSFLFIGITAIISLFVWATTESQPMPAFNRGKWVIQLNATFNNKNDYKWQPIPGVNYFYIDLDKNPKLKYKYKIKTVPTLIYLNNGREVKRWESDMSFKLNIPKSAITTSIK